MSDSERPNIFSVIRRGVATSNWKKCYFEGGKLYKMSPWHLLVLNGTHRQMGHQYVHLLKDQIHIGADPTQARVYEASHLKTSRPQPPAALIADAQPKNVRRPNINAVPRQG